MKMFKRICMLSLALGFIYACGKEDEIIATAKLPEENPAVLPTEESTHQVQLTLQLPQDMQNPQWENVSVVFINQTTQQRTSVAANEAVVKHSLVAGTYRIEVSGKVSFQAGEQRLMAKISAVAEAVEITAQSLLHQLPVQVSLHGAGLIIEELFFSGSQTPDGADYVDDVYFKIYNNSDEVIYADGLLLAKSSFQTIDKKDYTPSLMDEYFSAQSIIQLPGSGKQYPVQPGESIIIANQGINHKENNPNSADLSKAHFEYYYQDTDDVDAPQVPNTIALFDQFLVESRGYHAYAIIRLPEGTSATDFIQQNEYTFEWNEEIAGLGVVPYDELSIKVPNAWILDAVSLSTSEEYQWNVLHNSIDAGYASVASFGDSNGRYGKSVIRKKVQGGSSSGILYQDTNNSSADFQVQTPPTLF